jgi:DNA-binding SARP family transcriptional activator
VQDFRILGPLEILDRDTPVSLPGRNPRALLTLLLLRAGTVVATTRLVEELWGEHPPPTATTSLQNAVSQLRKALGADVVETRAPGYVLRVPRDRVDAHRFEDVVSRSGSTPAAERAETLRQALALWRGPALAEFALEEFAQPEIRRLDELRLTAIEKRIEAELELGHHADLVGELEALIAEHPLRERFRAQLMLALYRSGRQAEALRSYQEARGTLVEELGIDPGAELQRLQGMILRQEAGLAPGGGRRAPLEADDAIVEAILAGRVVPVLGLTSATQLAAALASSFELARNGPLDLCRVSQHVATIRGAGPLYDRLHDLVEEATEPGPVHRLLARLPPLLRERGAPHQLIVSTHYDLALERAFEEAEEEADVVSYVAAGPHRGKFWHRPPGGEPRPIDLPNTYASELDLERRTVILKLRGAIDVMPEREWESFVVTEDDHIDYLGRGELTAAVPVGIAAKLRRSHFLFLGYDMVDWNLRLILGRIWGNRPLAYASWAVQASPDPLEQAFWRQRDVDVLDVEPDAFAGLLLQRLTGDVSS